MPCSRVRSLTSLDLSDSKIDASTMAFLKEGLQEGLDELRVLDLSRNQCDANAMQVLLQAGSALSSLNTLRLNENKPGIGDDGLNAAVQALSSTLGKLQEREVRGPPCDTYDNEKAVDWKWNQQITGGFFPCVLVCTPKEWSTFGYSIVTDDGIQELLRLLQSSSSSRLTLRKLDLSGQNDISAATRTALRSTFGKDVQLGRSAFLQHACGGAGVGCSFKTRSYWLSLCLPLSLFFLVFPILGVVTGAVSDRGVILSFLFCYLLGLSISCLLVCMLGGPRSVCCLFPCCWLNPWVRRAFEINPHLRPLFPRLRPHSRPRQPVAVAGNDENSSGVELTV